MHLAISISNCEMIISRVCAFFLDRDHDAVDRAGALAGEASGADFEIDVEDAAVAERQRVLHADSVRSGYWTVYGLRIRVRRA